MNVYIKIFCYLIEQLSQVSNRSSDPRSTSILKHAAHERIKCNPWTMFETKNFKNINEEKKRK